MIEQIRYTRGYYSNKNRASWKWDFSCMEDYNIWMLRDGIGTFVLNGEKIELNAGLCIIIPPGAAGSVCQKAGHELSTVAAHFEFKDESPCPLPLLCRPLDAEFCAKLLEKCVRAGLSGDTASADIWLKAALDELLNKSKGGLRPESREYDIETLCRQIRLAPENEWNVLAMAEDLCLCREHFSRLFKNLKGLSPQQFVIKARIEKAAQLLMNTNLSISEIADNCGYSSVFFFCRQFKEMKGLSAMEFRNS